MSVVGKSDFSFLSEPDSTSQFNPGRPLRQRPTPLGTGSAPARPPAPEDSASRQLNAGWVATHRPERPIAPVFAFAGKLDVVTGWAENIGGTWNAMQQSARGGAFHWAVHHHGESYPTLWAPMQDPSSDALPLPARREFPRRVPLRL